MIKLIRRYQRWALAFCGVILMLTFLGNRGNGVPTDNADRVEGTLKGKAISYTDLLDARTELSTIERLQVDNPYGKEYGQVPLTRLSKYPDEATFRKMDEKPELFLLLRDEARASIPQPSATEIDGLLSQQGFRPEDTTSDGYIATREAITDLLRIFDNFRQNADDLRVSKPWLNHILATEGETIGINYVQLAASDYTAKLAVPTTQQCQDQFTKYADVSPGKISGGNPFGFGYKLPLRARVQSIRIPRQSVTAAIVARMDSFHWDVEGRKYYHSHLEDYRPAPPTGSATQPAIPLPIQPYEKVRDQVLKTIRQPMEAALIDQIESYLSTTMATAWQAYRQYAADPGASVNPEPDTSLGQRYTSFSFLRRLTEEVQSRFNVAISVNDTNQPLSLNDLQQLPGFHNQLAVTFLTTQTSAYLASPNTTALPAIAKLMQPSTPIQGGETDLTVILRALSVLPAQAPTDIASSLPQIQNDLRTLASYSLAKADADRLLIAANNGTLATAALAIHKPVLGTPPGLPLSMAKGPRSAGDFGPLDLIQPPLDSIDHSADSTQTVDRPIETYFMSQAFQLLESYDPKIVPHPAKLIELQSQARVFVTQLSTVNAGWTQDDYYKAIIQMRAQIAQAQLPRLAPKWFSYDAVVERTGYKSQRTADTQKS